MTRSGAGVNLVSSRPDFSSCSTIFLTFWLWLTGATKVASGGRHDRHVLHADRRQQPAVAAQVGVLAVDRDDIADDDIAVLVGRADVEQRLPRAEVVPAEARLGPWRCRGPLHDRIVDRDRRHLRVEVERQVEAGHIACRRFIAASAAAPDIRAELAAKASRIALARNRKMPVFQ